MKKKLLALSMCLSILGGLSFPSHVSAAELTDCPNVPVEITEQFEISDMENLTINPEEISTNGLFGTKYEVTGDNVNIRIGPGTSYDSVGKLYKGDVITVKSIENGWAKFKYNDQWRYISTSYIKTK